MNRFLAVVAIWLMVLVALAQGGPGGPGGPGGGGSPTISFVAWKTDWLGNAPATNAFYHPSHLPPVEGLLYEVVYQKGGSAQVQLFFQNNNPQQAFTGQLIVEDARYIHDSAPLSVPWGAPPPITIPDTILSAPTASLNIGIGQTAPATLTISGLPAFVTKGHIQLQLKAEGNFGAQPAGGGNPSPWNGNISSQQVLITFGLPTGAMQPVWIELAQLSCTMAQGGVTASQLSTSLTQRLYFSSIFWYWLPDGGMSYTVFTSTSDVHFNLTEFLGDMQEAGSEPGGCVDINSFLGLLHHSQGISAIGRKAGIATEPVRFVTNEFVPIGWDASQASMYIRVDFGWHFQIVSGDQVCDAAMAYRYDLQGANYMNPAVLWDFNGSWQSFVGASVFGLAYRRELNAEDGSYDHSAYYFDPVLPGPTTGQSEIPYFNPIMISGVY